MEDLDLFEKLVKRALSSVDQSYYSTTYKNIENFKHALQWRLGKIDGGAFERYGERVFCYEFYHQLRILIDTIRLHKSTFLGESKLQAEVQKMQVVELLDSFGLEKLEGEYAPDFLMHTPGSADLHPCVIEVKCEHNVSAQKVLTDVQKLDQFISRYKYQRGLFITTNSYPQYIQNVLDALSPKFDSLSSRGQIKVICKTEQNINPTIWQL